MVVSVHFLGLQRKLAGAHKINIPLLEESRVNDLLHYLDKQYPELSLGGDGFIVSVNDRLSEPDQLLKANDNIAIVPHIGGG
jgi:molybdopterin converting factor small subunit